MSFEYHEPASVDEAIDLLARYGKQARLLAGGTDLMVLVSRNKVQCEHMISLGSVPGLSGIAQDEQGNLLVGGLATHRDAERSPLLAGARQALPEACRTVGGVQVRNLGTIGGNLCNASPAADTAPVLLCLDAQVTLRGPEGARSLPVGEFLLGPRRTALGAAEILTGLTLPRLGQRTASVFLKAGRRKAMEIALCAVAARVTLTEDGAAEVRIGLGAVAPKAMRPAQAETLLEGKALTPQLIRQAAAMAASECSPLTDLRGSAAYRRILVDSMVERALTLCLERLQRRESARVS